MEQTKMESQRVGGRERDGTQGNTCSRLTWMRLEDI